MNIEIFNIARTSVDRDEVARWLDYLGVNDYDMSLRDISEPAGLIALAAKRCYMSFEPGLNPNVTKVRKDFVAYFDNILASGHGSVLEHSTFTYAFEGVSRVFTAEMNRHRAGWAISEGSLRFIRFDKDIKYWVPDSIQYNKSDNDGLATRKEVTRKIFEEVFKFVEIRYGELLKIWDMNLDDHNFHYKKIITSCLRRIVPLGVATGGVWTGNVRALRHVLAMRCSPAAEEEILHVFSRVAADIVDREPLLFGDFNRESGYWMPKYPKV